MLPTSPDGLPEPSSDAAPSPPPPVDRPENALPLPPPDKRSNVALATLMGLLSLSVLGMLFAQGDLLAAEPSAAEAPTLADDALPIVPMNPDDPYTFSALDIHPDRMFGEYFAGAFADEAGLRPDGEASHASDFRWRLAMYRDAYGTDDNFTVRVLDDRTGKTLEIATLRAERDAFRRTGQQEGWDALNQKRRVLTRGLREKWTGLGVPADNLVIRWGYKDQSHEARERDRAYIGYEVNLARRLGLSVLATEIGTVETFNQDHLVSSAGARSRFQMMPDILSLFNVERYTLSTVGGRTVEVAEELNPMLSMEPSLMLVRAYANSVGHELPGVSAYHTGPGNLFKLYTQYLRANAGRVRAQGQHVSDAYMWGVTDGFERVDAVSSFGPQSRAYVLKAYGALRATEGETIDPDDQARGELVQLRPGASVSLDRVLTALESNEARLDWSIATERSLYERFRTLNPHIQLPPAPIGGVPQNGNLRLVSEAGGDPVRFFLPIGATSVLRRVGIDAIGDVQVFDGSTFLLEPGDETEVDRRYARLVEDTGRFGFTRANQRRLEGLYEELQALARRTPDSRYRQTQAKIASIHRRVWRTADFESLVATTEATLSMDPRVAAGREPITSLAPVPPLGLVAPLPVDSAQGVGAAPSSGAASAMN